MEKKVYALLSGLIIAALALGSMSTAHAQEGKAIHLSDAAVFTGEVVSINKEDRALTLREPNGHVTELVVGEEARNFDQIVVGDLLKIEAHNSVDLYPEGPKEERAGAVIERAPKGEKPAAAVSETLESTVTIKAIDRDARALILELPGGNMITTKADNSVQAFDTLKVGDSFYARLRNSIAISVEKP